MSVVCCQIKISEMGQSHIQRSPTESERVCVCVCVRARARACVRACVIESDQVQLYHSTLKMSRYKGQTNKERKDVIRRIIVLSS